MAAIRRLLQHYWLSVLLVGASAAILVLAFRHDIPLMLAAPRLPCLDAK